MTEANETAQLVGCSVTGPKYEASDIPCQDSWHGYRLPEGQLVIAVGDGLGSSSQSEVGSELATHKAATELKAYLRTAGDMSPESANEALEAAFRKARGTLFETAEQRDIDVSELGTTLLAAIAGPSGVAGAVVGDGGIVCNVQGSYEPLVAREMETVDLAAPRYTYPIHHEEWLDSYRFDYSDEANGVAVFSDGTRLCTFK